MKKNLSNLDSLIRVVLALVSILLYFTGVVPSTSGLILIAIGITFLLTGFLNFCPIYFIFGFDSIPKKKVNLNE